MNERIKELIVESGNGQMRDGRLYPHIGIRFEEDWQRFAELIVKECVGLVNDQLQHNNPNDSLLALKIKEHFGVGE